MQELEHYQRIWNLSCPQPIAVTGTSHLYVVMWRDEPAVLKLLTPIGERDEKNSVVALRCYGGAGSVRLLLNDERAQLLEYADGEDLKALVERGDDEQATAIIVDVLNALHSSCPQDIPSALTPLRTRFRSLLLRADIVAGGKEGAAIDHATIYTKAAAVASWLLSTECNIVVLHGDLHHENVKHSRSRGWLAIDPKGLRGERTYDAANVLCNPIGLDSLVANETRLLKNAAALAKGINVERERLLAFTFAHAALSACWSLEDGQNPALALRICAILAPHLSSPNL